jgi:Tfp pilus assembly protein PilO
MRARILLGGLLAVLVGVGFYFLVLAPIGENTEQIEAQTASEVTREATLMTERNRLLRVQEAELRYIDAVGELEASIPTSPNQSELINALEALATESAVGWQGATFAQPATNEDGGYNEIQLNVQVTGQYFELLGYLYGMEELDRLIRINSASFAPSVEDTTVELAVTINATAFTTGEILASELDAPVAETPAESGTDDATDDTQDAVDEAEGTDDADASESTGG